MSAYILDNAALSQAARFLCWGRPLHQVSFDGTPEEIAEQLYEMNRDAVQQRYPEERPNDLPGPCIYGFDYRHDSYTIPPGQSLKTLECLLYQCSEGDIPERPLYKRLERVIRSTMRTLLERSDPEYRDASWGAYEPKPDQPVAYSLAAMMHRPKR